MEKKTICTGSVWNSLKKSAAVLAVMAVMSGIGGTALAQTEAAERRDGRPPVVENQKRPDRPKEVRERNRHHPKR